MKQGTIGIVVALLLAVFVIAGGAYYVGTQKKAEPVIPQQEATTTTQTPPTQTQVVAENTKPKLQTYRNDAYGFTVDYPFNFTFHDSQSTPDSWTITKLRAGRVLKPIDCGGFLKGPDEISVTWHIIDRQNPEYAGVNLVTAADKAYNNDPKFIPVVIGGKTLKVQRSIPGMCENSDTFIWMEPSGRYIVYFTVAPSNTTLIEEYKAIIASFSFYGSPVNLSPSNVLTQSQAEALVLKQWGGCTPSICGSVMVSVQFANKTQYMVTAIYNGLRDDSASAQKKEALATYQNGVWTLGQVSTTWSCQPNRGHTDFNTVPCL